MSKAGTNKPIAGPATYQGHEPERRTPAVIVIASFLSAPAKAHTNRVLIHREVGLTPAECRRNRIRAVHRVLEGMLVGNIHLFAVAQPQGGAGRQVTLDDRQSQKIEESLRAVEGHSRMVSEMISPVLRGRAGSRRTGSPASRIFKRTRSPPLPGSTGRWPSRKNYSPGSLRRRRIFWATAADCSGSRDSALIAAPQQP